MLFKCIYNFCCEKRVSREEAPSQRHFKSPSDFLGAGLESPHASAPFELHYSSQPNPTENDMQNVPVLQLLLKDSPISSQESEIKITPRGMEGSLRQRNDHCTYFGSVSREDDQVVNDYVVQEDETMGRKHFVVIFKPEANRYYVKDLGEGSGTFLSVEKCVVLKDSYLISFSNTHMGVHLIEENGIALKFLEGPKKGQVFRFTKEFKSIQIGRVGDCSIVFEGDNVSRYQCRLTFEDNNWVLYDGNKEKKSTNGTWIFASEEMEIVESMLIKAGKSIFEAKFVEGSKVCND